MPAFRDLLRRVAQYYREQGGEIAAQNEQLQAALAAIVPRPDTGAVLDGSAMAQARAALEKSFDGTFGGFSGAPKFPHSSSIERCMRQWYATSAAPKPDLKALYMATLTLTRMAEGGLFDQLGGGFARYSVDGAWMIPHFEKMLYDNGQLLCEYARAHLATGGAFFAKVAHETADWVLRDMRSPAGSFYSSLDADSEGHEGKFYVWRRDEVQSLLTPRNLRVWPARDEKILCSWNALTIKALGIASRVLGRPDLAEAAGTAVDFIRHHLWRAGRLLAPYKDGRAHLPAYLA